MARFSPQFLPLIVRHMILGEPWTPPRTLYLGLMRADEEISGGGYARQPVTLEATGDTEVSLTEDVVFPRSLTRWGRVSGVGIFTSQTGGILLFPGDVNESTEIGLNQKVEFAAGDLSFRVV